MNTWKRGWLAASVLWVAGCSGGSDSTVTVSAQNAEALAVQATVSTDFLLQMNDFVDQFAELFEDAEAQNTLCADGNAVITPVDVAPLGVLSTGDSITYTFNQCQFQVIGITFSFSGTIVLTATDVSGTPGAAFSRVMDVSYQSFTFGIGEAYVRVNGGFTVDANSADGNVNNVTISGSSLDAYLGGPNGSINQSWEDFSITRSEDTGANTFTMEFDGTYYGSLIGGFIDFETPVTVSGTVDANPDAGSFVITGVNGSKVRINALDNVNVQLLIDEDGDDVFETTINTTWAALDN